MSDGRDSELLHWRSSETRLLLAVPLACVVAAFIGFSIPHKWKIDIIAISAWGMGLFLLLATGFLAWRLYASRIREGGWPALRKRIPVLVMCGLFIVLYNQLDHRASKVIQDELIIQSSALQLLENNQYRIPQFSHNLLSEYAVYGGHPDKRPPMFAILLSTVHRILGYSTENGYLLNSLLGFAFLVTLSAIGDRIYPVWGAYILPASLASLPLLSQNVTSQHMEVLYILLIAVLLLLSMRIVRPGGSPETALAYLVAGLIAFTRYEGLIFLSIPFFLHMYNLSRGRPVCRLGWVFAVLPISMAFIFGLIGYIFGNPDFWQLEYMGNSEPFGLHFWPGNMGAFLDLMLNLHRIYPGSFPLSIMGISAFPVLIFHFRKRLDQADRWDFLKSGSWLPLASLGLCCLAFLILVFSYHWGEMNSHITARFALFPYLFLACCALYALRLHPVATSVVTLLVALFSGLQTSLIDGHPLHFSYGLFLALPLAVIAVRTRGHGRIMPAMVVTFWGIFIISETLPAVSQRHYERSYFPMKRTITFLEWCREFGGANNLILADKAYYGILTRQSSSSLARFLHAPEGVIEAHEKGLYENIYFLEYASLDKQGNIQPFESSYLPEDQFSYEVIRSTRFADKISLRLLRITKLPDLLEEPSSPEQ